MYDSTLLAALVVGLRLAVRNVTEVSLQGSGPVKVTSLCPVEESGGTHIQPTIILGKNILPTFQNTIVCF